MQFSIIKWVILLFIFFNNNLGLFYSNFLNLCFLIKNAKTLFLILINLFFSFLKLFVANVHLFGIIHKNIAMLANPMIVLIIARFIFSQIAPNDFINLILVKNEFCCYADKKDDFAKVVRLDFTLPQINCPVQYFKFIHHQSPCNVQK